MSDFESRKWVRWGIWLVILLAAATARTEEERTEPVTPFGELRASVTKKDAETIFSEVKSRRCFERVSPLGGCHKRSHVLSHLLDKHYRVDARRVQIYCAADMIPRAPWNADGKIGWTSHSAVAVRVTKGARESWWVMDPLFKKPLPLKQWIRRLAPPVRSLRHDVREVGPERIFEELPREGRCHYSLLPRPEKWFLEDLATDRDTLEKEAARLPAPRKRARGHR